MLLKNKIKLEQIFDKLLTMEETMDNLQTSLSELIREEKEQLQKMSDAKRSSLIGSIQEKEEIDLHVIHSLFTRTLDSIHSAEDHFVELMQGDSEISRMENRAALLNNNQWDQVSEEFRIVSCFFQDKLDETITMTLSISDDGSWFQVVQTISNELSPHVEKQPVAFAPIAKEAAAEFDRLTKRVPIGLYRDLVFLIKDIALPFADLMYQPSHPQGYRFYAIDGLPYASWLKTREEVDAFLDKHNSIAVEVTMPVYEWKDQEHQIPNLEDADRMTRARFEIPFDAPMLRMSLLADPVSQNTTRLFDLGFIDRKKVLEYERTEEPIDAILTQVSMENGISAKSISAMIEELGLMEEEELETIRIEGNYGVAHGFMRETAAEALDYRIENDSEFGREIAAILNDLDIETVDAIYTIKNLRVKIVYED